MIANNKSNSLKIVLGYTAYPTYVDKSFDPYPWSTSQSDPEGGESRATDQLVHQVRDLRQGQVAKQR